MRDSKPDSKKKMVVERGVPIPSRHKKGGELSALLRKLEIGDSFLSDGTHSAMTIASTARTLGIRTSYRRTSEGIRVWRVK